MQHRTLQSKDIRFITQFAILLSLEILVCLTPLGSLPAIGPVVATLSMVPVVIAAITMGTAAGSLMGFFFGLFSFLVCTYTPPNPITAMVFSPVASGTPLSLIVCFVPRILIGVVTGETYKLFRRILPEGRKFEIVTYGVSGFLGSLANTVFVILGIFFLLGDRYAEMLGVAVNALPALLAAMIGTSGIPEAIISAFAAFFIGRPLVKYVTKKS